MNTKTKTRTCGNCVFCISESVFSTIGNCAMKHDKSGNKELVYKGDTAEEKNCKHHLFKAVKNNG